MVCGRERKSVLWCVAGKGTISQFVVCGREKSVLWCVAGKRSQSCGVWQGKEQSVSLVVCGRVVNSQSFSVWQERCLCRISEVTNLVSLPCYWM
ncbi:hypothetical protein E2C01_029426 [Portunus trituberculatus]|uniref:Uncharacterized protein n=1 Tax=Portunus trituberculatus TaxID=210409 RepID=A0A5B7ERF4_PORTR|nr:hypothetical protein [Portunus trituberculatus]